MTVPHDPLLEFTRGKRVLIAGGQGAREAHRTAIKKRFQFHELDWEYSERKQAGFFTNLAARMKPGKYDFVLFLAGYSSHRSESFISACDNHGIRVVYLSRGYSVNQVAEAIKQQAMPKNSRKVK